MLGKFLIFLVVVFRGSTETEITEVKVDPTSYLGSSQKEVLNTKPDYQEIVRNQNQVFACMELVVSTSGLLRGLPSFLDLPSLSALWHYDRILAMTYKEEWVILAANFSPWLFKPCWLELWPCNRLWWEHVMEGTTSLMMMGNKRRGERERVI